MRVGDLSAAAASFESALRCNPADLNTLLSLTDVSLRQCAKAGAKKYWDRAYDFYPKDEKVLRLRGAVGPSAERAN